MTAGYLGGTFDPPHLGHLCLAQEAMERFSLDRIFFIPSRIPPHKSRQNLSRWEDRLAMLQLACDTGRSFQVADLEPSEGASYTVNLLEQLASQGEKPSFIMGMDSLKDLNKWREPRRILQLARILVGTRPGFSTSDVPHTILSQISLFDFPGVFVSSSDLRERIRQGRSISYLVPAGVESYIRDRGLYGAEKGN